MLTAHQTRMLSSTYLLHRDGRFVLRWKKYWWREDGSTFDLDGRPYRLSVTYPHYGVGFRSTTLTGPDYEHVSARFEKDHGLAITVRDRRYWLRRTSRWRRRPDVDLVWNGRVVGSVRFAGRFRTVVTADLPAEMSLPTQIFVVATALAT